MEKNFTDYPGQQYHEDLAALEGLRQSRRQTRWRWLNYVLVALCTAFVVVGSAKAYNCFFHKDSGAALAWTLDSSDDPTLLKKPKKEGFGLIGFSGSEMCASKNRITIAKGVETTKCTKMTVEFDSISLYNSGPNKTFSACLYRNEDCFFIGQLTADPVKGCAVLSSDEVKSFLITNGTECPHGSV